MHKYNHVFITAFLISACMIPFVRILAFRFGILDHPKSHGIHSHPVPRIGGIAIYAAFVIGSLVRMDLSDMLKGVLVGASIIFITGLLDDLIRLKASLRLVIQIAACSIMMFRYGVILDVFPNIWLNAFFTTLGIIGITNAVNFLDNMDGLASGLVMISSLALSIVAYTTKQAWLGYLSVALAGATAGFLLFNLKPAFIFMGDSGSTFLGFTLASLAVMTEWSSHWQITMTAPLLILGVPILDMILITILRVKENKVRNFKEWIAYAGKDHTSHRFMRLGIGKTGAVLALWGIQLAFCLLALYILPRNPGFGWIAFAILFLSFFGVIFFFRRKRQLVLMLYGRLKHSRQRMKTARVSV